MIKRLRFSVIIILWLCLVQKSYAQFPYAESFTNATAPGVVFGGAPSAFLTAAGASAAGGSPLDPLGQGYLRLTNAMPDQKGYAYNITNFPSKNGLSVSFEYYTYGGNGADGICFFLFDATANPFTIGGFGGSLGYAQITTTLSDGVSKGYLGIGLDEFGNFSNGTEGRQGGIGKVPVSVTLRGKGNGGALDPDNYRYLTSKKTDDAILSLVGDQDKRVPNGTQGGFRRCNIDLIPNPAGGYNITVRLTRGGSPQVTQTLIDNYYYPDVAPANLRYGFASSTGSQTNIHEIRNVAIDLYNGAPVANNDTQNVCVGITGTKDITANDAGIIDYSTIDIDPTIAGIQNNRNISGVGNFSVNTAGIVSFIPALNYTGTATTTYTVKNGTGSMSLTSNVATISFVYSAPPAATSAGPDRLINITTAIGSTTLQGSNPAPSTGLWTQVSGPTSAIFTTPALYNTTVSNLASGTYVFRWTATSAGGCSLSDDVQITVNHAPVAVDDAITTPLATAVQIPILANDTDADGNATINLGSITIKTPPTKGTLSINNTTGVVTYTPNAGTSGIDTFVYSIKDILGAESNNATVTVNVSQKPVGLPDEIGTPINTPVIVPVLTNDPVKGGAFVVKNTDPLHGTVVINPDGTITYTPTTGFSGIDSFTYILRNPGADSDPITVTVTVKPSGIPDLYPTFTNVPVISNVKLNDPAASGTTVIVSTNPLNGTVANNAAGIPVYTPNPGFSGLDGFAYILRTADGVESSPIPVAITVRPVGTADDRSTAINVPITIAVKNNDASTTGTTPIQVTDPTNGLASFNSSGEVVYTPTANFFGKDTFSYILRTTDGLDSEPITVTISIKPVGATDYMPTITNSNVTVDLKANDQSKTGTSLVKKTDPAHGTVTIGAFGSALYVPTPGFSGKDVFTYVLRTSDGVDSDPITVNIDVKPTGITDPYSTPVNIPKTLDVKLNDASRNGTTVIMGNFPTHGIATVNSLNQVIYTPNPGYTGTDQFTYILRTVDNLDSDPIIVNMTITAAVAIPAPDLTDATPTGTTIKINIPLSAGNKYVITIQPKNGTLSTDPTTGQPIYTPNPNYAGPDDFTYIIEDPDGNQSLPGVVVLQVYKIGLAKSVKSTIKNADGSYTITYVFTLVNYSAVTMDRISLTDDLNSTFLGNTVTVKRITPSNNLVVNNNYNGTTITEMLATNSTMAAASNATVELEVIVNLDKKEGTFNNTALVGGYMVNGTVRVTDKSMNGLFPDTQHPTGDISGEVQTPVLLTKLDIFIPKGFSPNGDGINDLFVIENIAGRQVTLDIFNRWGNRIHRSKAYQNEWGGKTTEGIHVGDDVPVGTYYYVITIDGTDKRVGYITISR